jgi:hypothetical protein
MISFFTVGADGFPVLVGRAKTGRILKPGYRPAVISDRWGWRSMSFDNRKSDSQVPAAVQVPTADFSIVLARTIESIQDDPAELRNAIYELARIKLQREAWQREPPMSPLEISRLMVKLEAAIERVETLSSQQDHRRLAEISSPRLLEHPWPDREESSLRRWPVMLDQPPIFINDTARVTRDPAGEKPHPALRNWIATGTARLLRDSTVILVVVVSLVLLEQQFDLLGNRAPRGLLQAAPVSTLVPEPPKSTLGFEPPTSYGVFALNRGQLYELAALGGPGAGSEGVHVGGHKDTEPNNAARRTGGLRCVPSGCRHCCT